jgi:N-acetylglucosaminyldiphosphoundecaprenol N-acetyl-beta-D-mannosaminyltransferase
MECCDRDVQTPPSATPPGISDIPRFEVLGVRVSALSLDLATRLILEARGRRQRGYVCLATANGVIEAGRDRAVMDAFNGSWLTTPDGMPMVWLGRHAGHPAITRVYGPDLMYAVCRAGRELGLKHFLYGGNEGVAAQLRDKLKSYFPGIEIVGTFTPPFRDLTPDEFRQLQAEVARGRPDVIWVGLSSPKQELFMAKTWQQLDAATMIGVGAAFDFLTGRVRQAPRWMQRSGLEWLFRLGAEPRRLWKRYLIYTPIFAARVLWQLGKRQADR